MSDLNLVDRQPWNSRALITLAKAKLPFEQLQRDGSVDAASRVLPFIDDSAYQCWLFKTKKGYYGTCKVCVEPGDKVAVLLGCCFAVVLRENPNGKHQFIGCTLVHGIIEGEVLLGPLPEGWKIALVADYNGSLYQQFVDPSSGSRTLLDPRLGPLPQDVEPVVVSDRLWPDRRVEAFEKTSVVSSLESGSWSRGDRILGFAHSPDVSFEKGGDFMKSWISRRAMAYSSAHFGCTRDALFSRIYLRFEKAYIEFFRLEPKTTYPNDWTIRGTCANYCCRCHACSMEKY
jgi:hypothetical protein